MRYLGPAAFALMIVSSAICVAIVAHSGYSLSPVDHAPDYRQSSQQKDMIVKPATAMDNSTPPMAEHRRVAPQSKLEIVPSTIPSAIGTVVVREQSFDPSQIQKSEGEPWSIGSVVRINFQHPVTVTPDGYLPDTGDPFSQKTSGFTYGWIGGRASESRERKAHEDRRYDTFIHMTKGPSRGAPGMTAPHAAGGSDGYNFTWAIKVPNGKMNIELVMGDPVYRDHLNSIIVNGMDFIDSDSTNDFDKLQFEVNVTEGQLRIRAHPLAKNPTLCFIHLYRK